MGTPHTPDVFGARGVLAKKPVTYVGACGAPHPVSEREALSGPASLRNQLHISFIVKRGARASATGRALACQTSSKILTYCIMRFDSLHFALLAVVVLLAVYGFGSGVFREGWRGQNYHMPLPPKAKGNAACEYYCKHWGYGIGGGGGQEQGTHDANLRGAPHGGMCICETSTVPQTTMTKAFEGAKNLYNAWHAKQMDMRKNDNYGCSVGLYGNEKGTKWYQVRSANRQGNCPRNKCADNYVEKYCGAGGCGCYPKALYS